MFCGNSILQKGFPFFYLHKIFYTLERMYEKGWKTGEVIGQYLLTNTDENNIRTEYYHAWIEMKK